MRTRIVAVVVIAAGIAFGLGPRADADPASVTVSNGRVVCGGVRSLDIGFCLDNPLP